MGPWVKKILAAVVCPRFREYPRMTERDVTDHRRR